MRHRLPGWKFFMLATVMVSVTHCADAASISHAPLRPLPQASSRPLAKGPALFVDATRGSDASDGSKNKPWKTINHALKRLKPGDTLYLRGGSYFENVYCAISGTAEKKITIRSFPGERAIISGGIAEFENDPAKAWLPSKDGVAGEYRSAKAYENIRDVVGVFGDSNLGLQTYWYRMDMQAQNEKWIPNEKTFVEPMYCGPGLWYDKATGYIHARLAHTKLELPADADHKIDQYRGETDPRKLPLVVAPFNSVPLFIDQAAHVTFQDVVIRGGGHVAVRLNFGINIEFDRCTIIAGTYGIWSKGTGPLKMTNCGVHGMIAPWMFRTENVSYSYSGKSYPPFLTDPAPPEIPGAAKQPAIVTRHISRLPTHAVLVTEGGFEFETFYTPLNHDWDISYCDFTEGHDGVYLSGRDIKFHHNLVDNMQDDAIYVSSPTPYVTDGLYIYQNLIRQCVAGFGAHARGGPGGKIYIYRNVVDMRENLQFNRPAPDMPGGTIFPGHLAWLVHNANNIIHMEDIFMYQNTTLTTVGNVNYSYCAGMVLNSDRSRRAVFNNLHVYTEGAAQYPTPWRFPEKELNITFDGNLHWHADPAVKPPANYFDTTRKHPQSEVSKKTYPAGWDANSFIADPHFVSYDRNRHADLDLRLKADSPAKGAGVALPKEWPDPLRPANDARPDIGAIPMGDELKVGIDGHTSAGESRIKKG